MCGFCNFACCNNETFKVWTNSEERDLYKEKYNLEVEDIWEQKGHCKMLKDDNTGCCLSDDRPIECKIFPLVENKTGRLILSNWASLHCPKPSDYELIEIKDNKYHYKLKKSHKNKRDELILNDDINNIFDEIWKQQKAEIKTRYVSSHRLFAEMEQAATNPLEEFFA